MVWKPYTTKKPQSKKPETRYTLFFNSHANPTAKVDPTSIKDLSDKISAIKGVSILSTALHGKMMMLEIPKQKNVQPVRDILPEGWNLTPVVFYEKQNGPS